MKFGPSGPIQARAFVAECLSKGFKLQGNVMHPNMTDQEWMDLAMSLYRTCQELEENKKIVNFKEKRMKKILRITN